MSENTYKAKLGTTKPAYCCHQTRLTALADARWAALHAGSAADLAGIVDSLIHQTKEQQMTNQPFEASNGITITISDEGYLTGKGGNEESVLHATGGAEYGVQALREFFRHERDQQLGRVRWPEDPDYVIYRAEENDDEDGRCIRVFHEPSANTDTVWERWAADPVRRGMAPAACWYFTEGPGKPERPWEDAQAGEVWRLTVYGEEGTYLVRETNFGTPYFSGQRAYLDAGHTRITAGRKLVNADGSMADD